MREPIAWRIVHPSGQVVFVDHKVVAAIVAQERPLCPDVTVGAVCDVYRSDDVAALYYSEESA